MGHLNVMEHYRNITDTLQKHHRKVRLSYSKFGIAQ